MEIFVDGQATSTSGGSTKTLTLTFATPFASGDKITVVAGFETETNTAVVTDGAGNIYTADTPYVDATLHWCMQWFEFYYTGIPGTSTIILTLANGVASKGVWAGRRTGIKQGAATQFAPWNKQVAPGTTANALTSNALTPAAQPYVAVALSMSKTGTASALPVTGTPGYNNRAASWSFAGGTGNCARMEDKRITSLTAFQATFTAGVAGDTYLTGMLMMREAPVVNPYKCNPMGLAYTSVTGVSDYAHKSGMLITGQGNRYNQAFADARTAGAEIMAYIDPVEGYSTGHTIGGESDVFYQVSGGVATVAPWPYTCNGSFGTTLGANRVNFLNTYLLDITPGSAWTNRVVAYAENLMRENKVDGIFLDVQGGRLFSTLAAWGLLGATGDWLQAEMIVWTAACVDLARRLDASRRAINPNFILVNNNTWDTGDALNNGFGGEQYVDGVDLEHHPSSSSYQQAYAGKTFNNLGHRRMLIIAQSTADAIAWAQIPGVTDVSDQAHYSSPSFPPIPFQPVNDRVAPVNQTVSFIRSGTGLVLPFSPGNITVSSVTVPNVVDTAKATAEAAIIAASLTVGSEGLQSSGSITSGNVIRQVPAAGASANVGSAVNLVLSSGATGFPLLRSSTVTGSDKSPQTGFIAPHGFVHDDGSAQQGGQIYPVTTTGRYWLRLEPLLGDTNARNITVSLFASANTVAGTHFTSFTNQVVSFADGEVGEKGVAIDILAIPTGMGLVGITIGGANPYRKTCWLWLQGTGHVAGATYVQTSNGVNAHGLTTGAGTSGSPYNSIEYAAAQIGDAGGFMYVKYNGPHKEYTSGVFAGNPGGQGIKLPNNCVNTSPLIILPDPDNATPLTLDQGVTGFGGSSVLFSNATGFDWSGITGNSIWICGFNLVHCNYSLYNQTGGPASDIVIWQSTQTLYASDQSNAAGFRIDNTESIILQDVYSTKNYSTESGHNFNPFDSVPAAIYEGVHSFSSSNASILHAKFNQLQYGCYVKDTAVNTAYNMSNCLFLQMAGGSTGAGNSGGPVAWPEQGGTANFGVMRYCASDATGSPVTIGHMWSCNGGGGTGSQMSYVDVFNCVQIGLSGLANITQVDHVRVMDCISQSATLEDIKVNNAGTFVSSLLDANGNLYVSSTHGWNINGTNYPNLAAWKAAALNAYLLTAPDANSTTTNTPPSYPSTTNHDYRVALTGGRRGGYIGVGLEQVTCVNNFLNSTLPTT